MRQWLDDLSEAAGHYAAVKSQAAQRPNCGAGSGRELHFVGDLIKNLGRQPGQGGHPLMQRFGEVDLTSHRRPGDGGHRSAGAGPFGQHLDDLALNQGGVDVEHDEPFSPSLEAEVLHGDVDALLGAHPGEIGL